MLVVALATVRPVVAASVLIGFEDMEPDAPPAESADAGAPVGDRYGAQGIVFTEAYAYRYPVGSAWSTEPWGSRAALPSTSA